MNRIFVLCIAVFSLWSLIGIDSRAYALPSDPTSLLIERDNLQWLSPRQSYHIAYANMSAQLRDGYFGLRYATANEVQSLVASYDLLPDGSLNPRDNGFINDFSYNRSSALWVKNLGWIDSEASPYASLMSVKVSSSSIEFFTDPVDKNLTLAYGHWLVRDMAPVPEPSTMLLLGSGLIAVVAYRKRTKAQRN